jgi:hypothetical protein
MLQNSVEHILCLKPLASQGDADSTSKDDWLNNSGENILRQNTSLSEQAHQPNQTQEQELSIDQVFDSLSDNINTNKSTYSVEHFEVKTSAAGPLLVTQNGDILLKDGDLITIQSTQYSISITKVESISHESPIANIRDAKAFNPFVAADIWQDDDNQRPIPTPLIHQEKEILAQSHQPKIDSDPLSFLYQQTPQSRNTPSLIPTAQTALPQQSSNLYAQDGNNDQGNILNDLGITQKSSTIVSQEQNKSAATYSDSSPMDMLDNFLDKTDLVQPITSHNQFQPVMTAQTPALPYQQTPIKKPTLLGGLRNALKRLSN